MVSKTQKPSASGTTEKQDHRWELSPLQAPNLRTPYYQGSTDGKVVGKGYDVYLSDYQKYLGALESIKKKALHKLKTKKLARKTPVGEEIVDWNFHFYNAEPDYECDVVVPDDGDETVEEEFMETPSGVVINYQGHVGEHAPLSTVFPGLTYTQVKELAQKASDRSDWTGITLTTQQDIARAVARPTTISGTKPAPKPEGKPSTKTVAEKAAAKAKALEKRAWFSERKLALQKGKIEEKLAASLHRRAQLVGEADKSVTVGVNLEGWNLVTRKKRGHFQKVITTSKAEGKTVKTIEKKKV